MRARCPRGSWLVMTTSGSSGGGANATAFSRKRLTHARSSSASSPFATHAGLHQQAQLQQQQQLTLAAPQVSLFASLATLAAAAATASPTTATPAPRNGSSSHHHHHSHLHHQSYHPYHKPSASVHSDNNSSSGSSDETEEDERADFKAEFNFHQPQPQVHQSQVQHKPQQHRSQFHPQHHHRLITSSRYKHTSVQNMPRRKETKKIQIDVPSSEACAGIVGDPHQVFKCNGSPIISPRSIRNSLAETDFDLDGNPRPQKIANTQPTFNGSTSASSAFTTSNGSSSGEGTSDSSNGSQAVAVFGPKVPSQEVSSPATSTSSNGKKKSSRRRNLRQQQQSQQSQQFQEDGNGDGTPQTEVDLLALKVGEQTLSGMSGVQLWVHRLLYTHHQTLHLLGIERGDFPNTKLSLKQLEVMLSPVISLANMMVPDHFGIHVPTPQVAQTMNDVHYWKLWESDTIDIGYVAVVW